MKVLVLPVQCVLYQAALSMSLTSTDLDTNDVANAYLPDYIWRKWTHGTILFTFKIRCRHLKTELPDPGKRQAGGGDVT